MPVYNSKSYILKSINSVISQSYKNWELIIINDCSNDGTENILKKYLFNKKIKIINNKKNLGPGFSRNIGLKYSSGNFISFIDSDDIWKKNKLKYQIEFMLSGNLYFTFTDVIYFQKNKYYINNYNVNRLINYKKLLKQNIIVTSSVMINKKILKNITFVSDGYDDYIFWLQILKKGYLAYRLNKYLTKYRIRRKSVSSNKLRSFNWVWNNLRNYQRFGFFESLLSITLIIFNTLIKKSKFKKL